MIYPASDERHWWITTGEQTPVGPATTDLVVAGLLAGMVPFDARLCEDGKNVWNWIETIEPFSKVTFGLRRARRWAGGDLSLRLLEPDLTRPADETTGHEGS